MNSIITQTLTVFFFLLLLTAPASAQTVSMYQAPITLRLPSQAMKDTETVELILPREYTTSKLATYPVLFVFDKQNRFIYQNTINNIDYTTAMMRMPACIIVGITYTGANRTLRTLPAYNGPRAKADDMLHFLLNELFPVLQQQYQAANFKLFIGHSRTAIFSEHAITSRPRDVNGIIASSASLFDFGSAQEQVIFEKGLDTIARLPQQRFFYFSTGDSLLSGLPGGDGHQATVTKLDQYLRTSKLPSNFIWKSYFHANTTHNMTPGLTVPDALNSIFSRHTLTLNKTFAKPFTTDTNQLRQYVQEELAATATIYGYPVQADITFYNSMAYHYLNGANELGDKKYAMAKFIWQQGIRAYPQFGDFYLSLADLYEREQNTVKVQECLTKALQCTNPFVPEAEQSAEKAEIKARLATLASTKK